MEIKLKYEIGKSIFFMKNNKVCSSEITGYEIKKGIRHEPNGFSKLGDEILYHTKESANIKEIDVFISKDELIKSL